MDEDHDEDAPRDLNLCEGVVEGAKLAKVKDTLLEKWANELTQGFLCRQMSIISSSYDI
jgi:hypothetical protein